MRHALLGGTFDPIHRGHIHAAKELATLCQLERVTLLPSALPPHKLDKTITAFEHRYAMAELAIRREPLFELSDYEYHKSGPSYTVETARHFKMLHPDDELFFIMGNDMAAIFSSWKSWAELLELVEPLVVVRPGEAEEIDPSLPAAVQQAFRGYYHHITTLDISSTMIRTEPAEHLAMLDPEVLKYIKEQKLYVQNIQ